MRRVSIEQIIRDERHVQFSPSDSSLLAYREFVAYFAALPTITRHNLIIGAHFTYGWMPTILTFKTDGFDQAVATLNLAKEGAPVTTAQLEALGRLINNSIVGASKLLHFVNPQLYAIWDSNVCRYATGKDLYDSTVYGWDNYLAYLDNCQEIITDRRFGQVHQSMNGKIGYPVSALRALELVMYMNGVRGGSESRLRPDTG